MTENNISKSQADLSFEKIHLEGWVDRYVLGKLSADEQRSFEEIMLDNDELQDEVHTAITMRSGLVHLGQSALEEEFSGDSAGWLERLFPARWASKAAGAFAAVAMVSVALLFMNQARIGELEQQAQQGGTLPINSSITLPLVRSGGDFEALGTLNKGNVPGWLVLNLELTTPDKPAYDVEIVRNSDDAVVMTINQVKPDALDNLVFALHDSEIPVGDYIARVVYSGGTQKEMIATYAFEVAGNSTI